MTEEEIAENSIDCRFVVYDNSDLNKGFYVTHDVDVGFNYVGFVHHVLTILENNPRKKYHLDIKQMAKEQLGNEGRETLERIIAMHNRIIELESACLKKGVF